MWVEDAGGDTPPVGRKEVVRIVSGCGKKMSEGEGVRSIRTEKTLSFERDGGKGP
jgi:hypothetical protein